MVRRLASLWTLCPLWREGYVRYGRVLRLRPKKIASATVRLRELALFLFELGVVPGAGPLLLEGGVVCFPTQGG